jgi:predicted nucleic acid-binding Zn ribbon protein
MKKLNQLLPDAIGRQEVLRASRAQSVLRSWATVVGPVLAERCQPDRYDNGTVWISVQGAAWAQEIRLMKPIILQRLNTLAGSMIFHDLRCGVRPSGDHLMPIEKAVIEVEEYDESLSIREIAERRLANWDPEKSS